MDFHEALKLIKKKNPNLRCGADTKLAVTVEGITELLHNAYNLGLAEGQRCSPVEPPSLFKSLFGK